METSIKSLGEHRARLERAYGPAPDHDYRLDVEAELGTLAELVVFATA